jgi:LPXTG-site transpeptidase (sortase) family protein
VAASRRRNDWLRAFEGALYALATVALLWYAGAHVAAAREQAALADELERSRATLHTVRHRLRSAPPAPRALVGRIDVPRLQLSALAREGVDTGTLRGSAGHVPGSALPGEAGNAAFAAHRDTYFRPLKGVRKGDEISITTADGEFHYSVSGTRVVDPSDVSVLRASSDPTLTLVTCYPFNYVGAAPKRFIVTATLVPQKPGA